MKAIGRPNSPAVTISTFGMIHRYVYENGC